MRIEEQEQIREQLRDVPAGTLALVRHSGVNPGSDALSAPLDVQMTGTGKLEQYEVFPGIEASFNTALAESVDMHHTGIASGLDVFYCRRGRIGWNMRGGISVYLGAGDVSIHPSDCCAQSAMLLPLQYAEGISISMDLELLAKSGDRLFQENGIDFSELEKRYCSGKPVTLAACQTLCGIFEPLYEAAPARRVPWLRLKVQELLLFLMDLQGDTPRQMPYGSRQTDLIREIHQMLTGHLDQRFTIEELSKKYLINPTTLKETFKAVYGQPIATYMKGYRMRHAMRLLRETDDSISDIAAAVGYESQGKFSHMFHSSTGVSPVEYRRQARGNP